MIPFTNIFSHIARFLTGSYKPFTIAHWNSTAIPIRVDNSIRMNDKSFFSFSIIVMFMS